MHSLKNLLERVRVERADALRIQAGIPPIIVHDGMPHILEGPIMSQVDTAGFLHSLTNTRQRRELRERGTVQLIHMFRRTTPFVVCVSVNEGGTSIEIH